LNTIPRTAQCQETFINPLTKTRVHPRTMFIRQYKPILMKMYGCPKKSFRLASYQWQKLSKREQLKWCKSNGILE
ncbi:hypothetical protein HDV02_000178, partial [Globomyces sp. JEL0801]